IVLGGGGHAQVVVEMARLQGLHVIGMTLPDPATESKLDLPCLGTDEALFAFAPEEVTLLNGVGSVAVPTVRRLLFEKLRERGYSFAAVIHPAAAVSGSAALAEGVQVMAGAIIQPGCVLGANSIVNTKASLDHNTRVGTHVHVAPGATVCGEVQIGDAVHIGAGATVLQGVRIGTGSVIGAGALVVKDVASGATVMGVPAKEVAR
ncbi:MAG: acetyltransferase, partial [Paenibacillaceae bacterium]|nr:acetyltransferase [Paenibacillaceae bacterium]